MLMKVVIAIVDRASHLDFGAELRLEPARRAGGVFDHADRHARLIFASQTGKELINDMDDCGHLEILLCSEPLNRSTLSSFRYSSIARGGGRKARSFAPVSELSL